METNRLPWEMAFGLCWTTMAALGWQRSSLALINLLKRVVVKLVVLRFQGLFYAALVLTQTFCQMAGLKITTGWCNYA